jgi:protein-S-isoprenylcysteine O-methyltransferase Ste14
MFGFLLQWPTLLTLAMFPILVWMYVRLAIVEERDAEGLFGPMWRDYAARTPRFFPNFGSPKEIKVDAPPSTAKP